MNLVDKRILRRLSWLAQSEPAEQSGGYLYFGRQYRGHLVKVGRSRNVKRRLGELGIDVIDIWPLGHKERWVHLCLKPYRHNREWFEPGPWLSAVELGANPKGRGFGALVDAALCRLGLDAEGASGRAWDAGYPISAGFIESVIAERVELTAREVFGLSASIGWEHILHGARMRFEEDKR